MAILAIGGQGGGVLADWVVALAESQGWHAQSTSVPGVAQRTGATVYYIEMLPPKAGRAPVLSMMPTMGDVDVVISAEFMEAGRSMLRGFVTPDRTTLISSTHRILAVAEKEVPGTGIGAAERVHEAAGIAAKRIIAFDMGTLASENGTVVSACLFGALAAADVLPFPRPAFEAVIGVGERGAAASLKGFAAAFAQTQAGPTEAPSALPLAAAADTQNPARDDELAARIKTAFPGPAQAMLASGASRLVDYQDRAYAIQYLDRMALLSQQDAGGARRDFTFTTTAAKYLAVAMAYDDVIRVADLKTRASRFDRVRAEIDARPDDIVYMTEFMHPRMQEITGLLPARIGGFIEARPRLFKALDRLVNRPRRVRTGNIFWFLVLYGVSGLRRFRRGSLRHQQEMAHIESWLVAATDVLASDYDLAVEILACRRLVKGYSDTHSRGEAKFDKVIGAIALVRRTSDPAGWLRRLKQAALADEAGTALDGALKTLATLD